MRKKNIKINFFDGGKSLQEAIRQIEQYRDELPRKAQQLCQRLSEMGKQTALTSINQSEYGNMVTLKVNIEPSKIGCKAMIIGTGRTITDQKGRSFNLLYGIEFGSGITYNPTDNPLASEFGMGIGSFPGQTHAFDKGGWAYLDKNGYWHHSYGIKATMPFYKAMREIRQNISKVEKEVFG